MQAIQKNQFKRDRDRSVRELCACGRAGSTQKSCETERCYQSMRGLHDIFCTGMHDWTKQMRVSCLLECPLVSRGIIASLNFIKVKLTLQGKSHLYIRERGAHQQPKQIHYTSPLTLSLSSQTTCLYVRTDIQKHTHRPSHPKYIIATDKDSHLRQTSSHSDRHTRG